MSTVAEPRGVVVEVCTCWWHRWERSGRGWQVVWRMTTKPGCPVHWPCQVADGCACDVIGQRAEPGCGVAWHASVARVRMADERRAAAVTWRRHFTVGVGP